jgi:hypothetical protein
VSQSEARETALNRDSERHQHCVVLGLWKKGGAALWGGRKCGGSADTAGAQENVKAKGVVMAIRRAILLTGLVLAVTALSPASGLAKAGGTDRPVKGTVDGDVMVSVPALDIATDASGLMTHLGRYTAHFEGSAEIVGGRTLGEGIFTVVAANGDELTGTFTLNGALPSGEPHSLTVVLTVMGGTGRFADASGTITAPLVATPSCFLEPACPGALVETLEGQLTGLISY